MLGGGACSRQRFDGERQARSLWSSSARSLMLGRSSARRRRRSPERCRSRRTRPGVRQIAPSSVAAKYCSNSCAQTGEPWAGSRISSASGAGTGHSRTVFHYSHGNRRFLGGAEAPSSPPWRSFYRRSLRRLADRWCRGCEFAGGGACRGVVVARWHSRRGGVAPVCGDRDMPTLALGWRRRLRSAYGSTPHGCGGGAL